MRPHKEKRSRLGINMTARDKFATNQPLESSLGNQKNISCQRISALANAAISGMRPNFERYRTCELCCIAMPKIRKERNVIVPTEVIEPSRYGNPRL